MIENIKKLQKEIDNFESTVIHEIEEFRIKLLSKKGEISALFNAFKNVPAEQKKELGQKINLLKQSALDKVNQLKNKAKKSESESVYDDLTRPAEYIPLGARHPISLVRNEIIVNF